MPAVKVELGIDIKAAAENRLKDLARDLAAMARLPGVPAGDVQRIKEYSQNVRSVGDEYRSASGQAFSLFEKTKSLGSAAVGGAGLGRYGMLLGAGGVAGAVAAAAGIAAQLARMQYTFLETTTKSAATLSIGSENFARNLEVAQRAAFQGVPYGYTQNTMASALAGYGRLTGYQADTSTAETIARYSRASGLEPDALAGGIAGISQFGGDPKKIIGEAFDYAMTSGAFGRRQIEFIQSIQNLTQQLLLQNPNLSGGEAARMAAAMIGNTAARGGVYATLPGNASAISALTSFAGGVATNPALVRLARSANVSIEDILLGKVTPAKALEMLQIQHGIDARSGPAGREMDAAFAAQFSNPAMIFDWMQGRNKLLAPPAAHFNATRRARAVQATNYGQITTDLAGIVSPMQADVGGEVIDKMVIPALNGVESIVKHFADHPDEMAKDAEAAMIALLAVQQLGNAGIIGNLVNIARAVGAAAFGVPAAIAGGTGAALLGVGALATVGMVLATTATAGNANEADRVKNFNKFRPTMHKPDGMSEEDWGKIVYAGVNQGVDPDLLAAVYGQESDYGRSLTAAGTNKAGNAFGGFQLTAGAGKYGSLMNRLRAAHDLEFGAEIAAQMIKDNIAERGNVRDALSEYGPDDGQLGGTPGAHGIYASQVESRYATIRGMKVHVETKLTVVGGDRSSTSNQPHRSQIPGR